MYEGTKILIFTYRNIYESIQLESDPIHGECDSNTNNVPSATSHELMKRKLQWELAKRKELQTKLISVLQKKKEFEIGLEGKRRKIDELRSHLQTFLKVKCKRIEIRS